ncbi:MAG TPA: hypothetical protein VLS89_09020, partial [Candidatus Nanopelagicales bacterium]|nr:hypothetical protein [Candidatus Nanopelagicales bacterium]
MRAELVAAGWELFSALLFVSAVVPAAFSTASPGLLFLGSMVVSAAVGGELSRRGDPGLAVAALIRVVAWPLASAPLLARAGSPGAPSQAGLVVAALAFGVMAGGVRRAIYRRMLVPAAPDAPGTPSVAELRQRVAGSAMTAGIVGGHLMLLFIVAFLRTRSQVVFRAWVEVVPLLAMLGTFGFTLGLRPATGASARALAGEGDPARGLA